MAMNATMLTTLKKSAMGVVWIRSYKQEVNKRRMPLTEDQWPDGERYHAATRAALSSTSICKRGVPANAMSRSLLKFSGGHSVFRLLPDRTLRLYQRLA